MSQVISQIFVALLIAAFTSWITVQFSLRRYRTEKWWERKAEAYSKIIEALYDSKTTLEVQYEADLDGRQLQEERIELLDKRARAARDDIMKATNIGAFLLSDVALDRLSAYQNEASEAARTPHWHVFLDDTIALTNSCIEDLIAIARKDLRIKI